MLLPWLQFLCMLLVNTSFPCFLSGSPAISMMCSNGFTGICMFKAPLLVVCTALYSMAPMRGNMLEVSTSALQSLQMSLHGRAQVSNRVTQHTFTGNFEDFTAQMVLSSVCQAHAFGNFVMPGCRGVSCGPIAQVIPLTIFSHLATTQSVNCTDRLREEDQRRPGPGQPNRSMQGGITLFGTCLLYTSPSPRDRTRSRMPSSA